METIWNYLDNMFVNLPQTSEVLRAKEDLAEMMEDKYNELIKEGKMQNEAIGIVISEFGNIQELIDELGIASFTNADFVKKEQEEQDHRKNRAASNLRHVSGLEADEYLFAMKQGSMNIATGVFLCICSPILLLLLTAAQKSFLPVAEGLVLGLGLTVLLCMVASAVALFIISGMKLEAYEYLQKECFTLDQDYEYALRRSTKKSIFNKDCCGSDVMYPFCCSFDCDRDYYGTWRQRISDYFSGCVFTCFCRNCGCIIYYSRNGRDFLSGNSAGKGVFS